MFIKDIMNGTISEADLARTQQYPRKSTLWH